MTEVLTVQDKYALKANIEAVLIELKNIFGFSSREVAKRLSINESYLSRVYNGRANGSQQLLQAMKMLYELECLKSAAINEGQRKHFLDKAEKFNHDPVAKGVETLASCTAEAVKKGRKRRPPPVGSESP